MQGALQKRFNMVLLNYLIFKFGRAKDEGKKSSENNPNIEIAKGCFQRLGMKLS